MRERRDDLVRAAAVVRVRVLLDEHVRVTITGYVGDAHAQERLTGTHADQRDRDAPPWRLIVRRREGRLRPEREAPANVVAEGVVERRVAAADPLDEDLVGLRAAPQVPDLAHPRPSRREQRQVEPVRIVRSLRERDDGKPTWLGD